MGFSWLLVSLVEHLQFLSGTAPGRFLLALFPQVQKHHVCPVVTSSPLPIADLDSLSAVLWLALLSSSLPVLPLAVLQVVGW